MRNEGRSQTAIAPIMASALLGLGVFSLCLAGILSRPLIDLATFWPANAFMLGMMVRFPILTSPWSWWFGAIGFFMADVVTGSELHKNLILNGGNLMAIAIGCRLLCPLSAAERGLRSPGAIPHVLVAMTLASAAQGALGALAGPILFGDSAADSVKFWTATELMNLAAFMPMFLCLPAWPWRRLASTLSGLRDLKPIDFAPLPALAASAAIAVLIGGPGAFALPIPALIWCALRYRIFAVACLTFAYGTWTLIALRLDLISLEVDLDARPMLISLRFGITLIAQAPLVVAILMAAQHELTEKLRFQAERDILTGLRNRRSFFDRAQLVLSQAVTRGQPSAILMLDVDRFKTINDTYGHLGGDRVLVAVARLLESRLRPQDIVGRIGGEEFAILLSDCDLDVARVIAERLIEELRSQAVRLDAGQEIRVTASIGLHVSHASADLERLLAEADRAMYQAKLAGRDRLMVSTADPDAPLPDAAPDRRRATPGLPGRDEPVLAGPSA